MNFPHIAILRMYRVYWEKLEIYHFGLRGLVVAGSG
jgi:hypothetical protein